MGAPPRPLKPQPLWVRVDQNRTKLTLFVVLFVVGSAVLLTLALVGVPGLMLSWGLSIIGFVELSQAIALLPLLMTGALLLMLVVGGILAAVQLSNAEDWVSARFRTREPTAEERDTIAHPLAEMSIAAGLAGPPRIAILPSDSINALAIGTTRKRPVIAVTTAMLASYSASELSAVMATLIARMAAGDILFGTALAALMGPLRAIREVRRSGADAEFAGGALAGCADNSSCATDGCLLDGLDDSSDGGCLAAIGIAVFLAVTAALTYVAVLTAAWIVTLWGRVLHRTSYEKADGEGMLLLKDPDPAMYALARAMAAKNDIAAGDVSYDGIFYVSTSGTPRIERVEMRRLERLAEVLGADGATALQSIRAGWNRADVQSGEDG